MSESKSLVTAYGNAPEGEHPAIFMSARRTKLVGMRLLFQFLILDSDQKTPLENEQGEPYYAVAVCNDSKCTSPKSKPYKICKAMLRPDEYDPIDVAIEIPNWEHFAERLPDGTRRIIWVRVERRGSTGQLVSLVTHIKSPRDGVWEPIEGKFEGRRLFKWLNKDGRRRQLSRQEEKALMDSNSEEFDLYGQWNAKSPPYREIWLDKNGHFVPLSSEQVASLRGYEDRYRVAELKAELGFLTVAGEIESTDITQSQSNATESTTCYAAAAPSGSTASPPSPDDQESSTNEDGESREEVQQIEITANLEELLELVELEENGRSTKS